MKVLGICGKSKSGKDALADLLVARHGFAKVALADPMKRFIAQVFGFTPQQLWGPSSFRNEPDPRFTEPSAYAAARVRLDVMAYEWLVELGVPAGWRQALALQALVEWFTSMLDKFEFGNLEKALTPRRALQTLGTEFGRNLDPEIWIDALRGTIDQIGRCYGLCYSAEDGILNVGLQAPPARMVVVPDVRFANEVAAIEQWGGFTIKVTRFAEFLPDGGSLHSSETAQDNVPNDRFRHSFQNVGGVASVFCFVDKIARELG